MEPIGRLICLGLLGFGLSACVQQPAVPPFRPVTTVQELMESVVAHTSEIYWDSVSIVVDENGISEQFPESDEEWEEVWAAAIGLAESGNLLMMAPRAVDEDAWMRYSSALVDVGIEAARAALDQDTDAVFETGERIYSVCLGCHTQYASN